MQILKKSYLVLLPLLFLFNSLVSASDESESMTNQEIVKAIYAGFESGNMDAILLNMSDDLIWLHPGDPGQIPFAGKFVGKAGVQRFFDIAFSSIDVLEQTIHSFEASGDKVLVVGFEHMRVKNTGKEYKSNWIHMYTFADGKVVQFEEFIDTAALASAFASD